MTKPAIIVVTAITANADASFPRIVCGSRFTNCPTRGGNSPVSPGRPLQGYGGPSREGWIRTQRINLTLRRSEQTVQIGRVACRTVDVNQAGSRGRGGSRDHGFRRVSNVRPRDMPGPEISARPRAASSYTARKHPHGSTTPPSRALLPSRRRARPDRSARW